MTTKIVVGIDGSAPSRASLTWAMERARRLGASVKLVYVSDISPFSQEPAFLDEAIAAATELLAKEREYALTIAPDVEVSTNAVPGVPVRELASLSKDADLLVIGTHKGAHMQDVIVGTKGIKLAAVSPVPVAVIPADDGVPRRGVVVGVDDEKSSTAALDFAAAEARALGEPLVVVYAWTLPMTPSIEYVWTPEVVHQIGSSAEALVVEKVDAITARYPGLEVVGFAAQGSPVQAIVHQAKTASLVVVGNRGRRGLSRLLLGSVSHGVLNNIPAPTIVVRAVPVPDGSLDEG